MTIVALAVESSQGLMNSIVIANTPFAAAHQILETLEFEEGEVIFTICADVLLEDGSDYEPEEFAQAVETHFEQAAPELFAEGYFEQ